MIPQSLRFSYDSVLQGGMISEPGGGRGGGTAGDGCGSHTSGETVPEKRSPGTASPRLGNAVHRK